MIAISSFSSKARRLLVSSAALLALASGAIAQQCQPLVAENTLYAFTQGDGPPSGGLVTDSFGALYGLSRIGGGGYGAAFKLTPPLPPATSWTKSVIYAFGERNWDGYWPLGSLTLGAGGALYGMTERGGMFLNGTVFRLTPPVSAYLPWTETVLYDLQPGRGIYPEPGLVADSVGGLYGAMLSPDFGAVFKLPPASLIAPLAYRNSAEITLYEFTSIFAGSDPAGPLVFGPGGALYGTTYFGGTTYSGAVFKLTPPVSGSGPWTESVLYSFLNGADGAHPSSGVTLSADGSLYGATTLSASQIVTLSYGTVYKLTPGAGSWSKTILHSFTGGADGASPGGVIIDNWGAVYGVASGGGLAKCTGGCGLAFKLTPPVAPATQWTKTVLHAFNGADGASPQTTLVFDHNGGLYGTTASGGPDGNGVVFKVQTLNSPPGCL
jgi:hypothetical protein